MSARAASTAVIGFGIVGKNNSSKDVKTYLVALYSYADQAALHRDLSFQKHLLAVMGIGQPRAGRRSRRWRMS
jgi:hypothetical protein